VPPWQAPFASHASDPLQTSPSRQAVPVGEGVLSTPKSGSQESTVQALPSSGSKGVPVSHAPAPSQNSMPLQRSPSPQAAPAGTGSWVTAPVSGSQEPIVHSFPSSVTTGIPA